MDRSRYECKTKQKKNNLKYFCLLEVKYFLLKIFSKVKCSVCFLCVFSTQDIELILYTYKLTAQGGGCHRGNTVRKNFHVYMKSLWTKRAGKSLGFKKDKEKAIKSECRSSN